jgi:antitoxin (DNA-binding transcriptional repressor) of toxin-antitoxin stability system
MKRAKVSELKARLSSYLADVRGGATVVVCDRNTPIAHLVPTDAADDGFQVREPTRPLRDLRRIKGIRPKRPVDVVALLREARDQR